MDRSTGELAAALLALGALQPPAPAAVGGETFELLPGDAVSGARFGASVALEDPFVLVGAPRDDDNGVESGSVYVFDRASGRELAKLLPADGAAGDAFGTSVTIGAGTVVVGAPGDDDSGPDSGSVYVFDAGSGLQLSKLVAADGAGGDEFGTSVAIHGCTAVVGAPHDGDNGVDSGSAYLFEVGSGQQLAKLVASDGLLGDHFGQAVAISGSRVIVGASVDDDNGFNSGSAYVFDATTGLERGKLLPADGELGDWFGTSVAIDGTTAILGAPGDEDSGPDSGSAYLFDADTGLQLAKLQANDGMTGHFFGWSVSIRGDTAVVGAIYDAANGYHAGSAYLFDVLTGQQVAELLPTDGDEEELFGISVGLEGSTAVVGAFLDDDNGPESGSAYLFDVSQAIAVPYCFGTGDGTPCPCGNVGQPGNGCANSAFAEGARLWSSGSACVSADDLTLRVESSRPTQPGLFFQGDDAAGGGLGVPFGDGLRCAGTNLVRLEVRTADPEGAASSTVPLAATAGLSAGDLKRYQWWYRDPGASPCGSEFNLSNGLEVVWGT